MDTFSGVIIVSRKPIVRFRAAAQMGSLKAELSQVEVMHDGTFLTL